MNDFLNEIFGKFTQTKEEITKKYIQGIITKDEFIKQMNQLKGKEK